MKVRDFIKILQQYDQDAHIVRYCDDKKFSYYKSPNIINEVSQSRRNDLFKEVQEHMDGIDDNEMIVII